MADEEKRPEEEVETAADSAEAKAEDDSAASAASTAAATAEAKAEAELVALAAEAVAAEALAAEAAVASVKAEEKSEAETESVTVAAAKPDEEDHSHGHSAGHGAHDEGHFAHTAPAPMLIGVFVALILLTILTVGVTAVDLGANGNLVVAMVIATVKAALVMGYFMHMFWDNKFNVVAFTSSFLFVILFLAMSLTDRGEYQDAINHWEADKKADELAQ